MPAPREEDVLQMCMCVCSMLYGWEVLEHTKLKQMYFGNVPYEKLS